MTEQTYRAHCPRCGHPITGKTELAVQIGFLEHHMYAVETGLHPPTAVAASSGASDTANRS